MDSFSSWNPDKAAARLVQESDYFKNSPTAFPPAARFASRISEYLRENRTPSAPAFNPAVVAAKTSSGEVFFWFAPVGIVASSPRLACNAYLGCAFGNGNYANGVVAGVRRWWPSARTGSAAALRLEDLTSSKSQRGFPPGQIRPDYLSNSAGARLVTPKINC
jgi:hypothetical protein